MLGSVVYVLLVGGLVLLVRGLVVCVIDHYPLGNQRTRNVMLGI